MKKARHDANVVAVDTMRLLARLLGEHIAISVEQSSEPLWFDGDAGMIGQVLTNLSLNARDAMPNGGRLTIRVGAAQPEDGERPRHERTAGGRSVCLAVEDAGCGIASEVLPHIFEPFFTTKSVGRGTGLGLATAHGIVANHGGFMEVDSRVGVGTTFRVYLPIAETALVEEPSPSSKASIGGTERILLVEDEPAVRWVSARCLRRLGYRVTEATSGVEALEIWADEAGEFDLLFTDMVMPGGVSGADLCARLRADKPTLRTLITSAYSAERLGAPDSPTLQKPYDVATLAAAIRACLDSAETVRAPEMP
jgi:CheY-like chemotaxis protein